MRAVSRDHETFSAELGSTFLQDHTPEALEFIRMTILNMASMGGVFLCQSISGVVIELFSAVDGVYPLAAYRTVFALQASWTLLFRNQPVIGFDNTDTATAFGIVAKF